MRLRERRSRISALAIVIAVTVLAVPLGGGTWLAFRDPLAALPRAAQAATVKESASVRGQGRERRRIVLNGGGLGDVRLRVSLPDPVPNAPMPVVFVLGGLRAGERSLCRLPEPGANVLVGYDWPVGERLPDGIALWRRVPDLYRQAFSVPGQVSTALRWIAAQPWADKKRISLVGLSLGALAAPAVQRVAAAQGVTIRSTVLGFGGSPFGALLANHPDLEPAALRGLLGHGVGLLMRPLDPASHLPHLEGKFLVFAGTGDTLIPPAAARRYADLVPAPKTVRWLESDHVGVGGDGEELILQVIGRTVEWLKAEGAFDRSGRSPMASPAAGVEC